MTSPSASAVRYRPEPPDRRPASVPLVATKLEPPPLPPTYATRARLADLLARGSAESCQLALVSAPPGYGKTIAVQGWLVEQDRPFAWLSVDEGDDDPDRAPREA